jgi:processive 1,2-diacylglycerol beta-glucosyltransferase
MLALILRILILAASVGAGHMRAAEAVELAFRNAGGIAEGVNQDVLALMPKAFQKVYRDTYFAIVSQAPQIVGWLYQSTDKPASGSRLRERLERFNSTHVLQFIREFNPDIAVCTHFLPASILARERRKGRYRGKILTVVTDFEVHGMWLKTPSDHYFVATEEARVHLEALGVASSAITVSGIPTHPVFAQTKDRAAMRRKHGWHADLPGILVSAGGFGVGNAVRMVQSLVDAQIPAQVIAVCGKSASLKSAIEKIANQGSRNALPLVKAVGFTTDMDEFMSAADLMIGKPGGLTTSESLVKGLAWVVVNPIPGQEEKNAIYLLEQGAGIWCDNLHTLAFKAKRLLAEPARLPAMRACAARLGRPDAGPAVARFVLGQ